MQNESILAVNDYGDSCDDDGGGDGWSKKYHEDLKNL